MKMDIFSKKNENLGSKVSVTPFFRQNGTGLDIVVIDCENRIKIFLNNTHTSPSRKKGLSTFSPSPVF